jgi:hypothetical protein
MLEILRKILPPQPSPAFWPRSYLQVLYPFYAIRCLSRSSFRYITWYCKSSFSQLFSDPLLLPINTAIPSAGGEALPMIPSCNATQTTALLPASLTKATLQCKPQTPQPNTCTPLPCEQHELRPPRHCICHFYAPLPLKYAAGRHSQIATFCTTWCVAANATSASRSQG